MNTFLFLLLEWRLTLSFRLFINSRRTSKKLFENKSGAMINFLLFWCWIEPANQKNSCIHEGKSNGLWSHRRGLAKSLSKLALMNGMLKAKQNL